MEAQNTRKITLKQLTKLDTQSQFKIRDIRNEEGVRKWMYTDHTIGANEHLAWINKLKSDNEQMVFAVLDENESPQGVVSLNAIDQLHLKADWAYYLTSTARGGLGSALEFSFINFVFDVCGIQKLNCEVIEGNDAVVKLHKKFLFQSEGMRRSNVFKYGNRIGVHLLGLTKDDWLSAKEDIHKRYSSVLDKFEVSIQWKIPEEEANKDPIDQIEAARARNNLNWMSILRMAIEKCPDAAIPIVSDIKEIDREISDLTQELLTPKDESMRTKP